MAHPLFWSHQTTLDPDIGSVSLARDFVGETLLGHDLPVMVTDIRLVVSELVAVVIAHHGDEPFTVMLRGGGGAVVLVVQNGFANEVEHLASDDPVDDAGDPLLAATKNLSHRYGVEDLMNHGGAAAWASFDVTPG